jgi:hypothetical protein
LLKVAEMGLQADERMRQVDALAEAGEGGGEDLMVMGASQGDEFLPAPAAMPGAVDQAIGRHRQPPCVNHRWRGSRARR